LKLTSYASYAELQRLLSECRAVIDPAEAHGTLTGALCANGQYALTDWVNEVLPDGVDQSLALAPLGRLYQATADALAGHLMEFDLLLPDDAQPIEARTEALTLWCNGFLYGLGTGGAADPQRLPGDAGEIIRDLSQITQAGVDTSEDAEANESALADLVEFARVGVQLIYEHFAAQRAPHRRETVALH
jgi:uncharacterized protein YgfB (UPF0149 family)